MVSMDINVVRKAALVSIDRGREAVILQIEL